MPASGGDLSIWYGSNSGSPDLYTDIWLATTSANGGSFLFGGNSFTLNNNLAVASYKEDVYGLYLGTVDNPVIGSWSRLTAGEFGTGKKEFWVFIGIIDYSDFLPEDWMYAATTGSGVTAFSPKITFAAVPEPTTMLLLGLRLVGLAGFGRKNFFKK